MNGHCFRTKRDSSIASTLPEAAGFPLQSFFHPFILLHVLDESWKSELALPPTTIWPHKQQREDLLQRLVAFSCWLWLPLFHSWRPAWHTSISRTRELTHLLLLSLRLAVGVALTERIIQAGIIPVPKETIKPLRERLCDLEDAPMHKG